MLHSLQHHRPRGGAREIQTRQPIHARRWMYRGLLVPPMMLLQFSSRSDTTFSWYTSMETRSIVQGKMQRIEENIYWSARLLNVYVYMRWSRRLPNEIGKCQRIYWKNLHCFLCATAISFPGMYIRSPWCNLIFADFQTSSQSTHIDFVGFFSFPYFSEESEPTTRRIFTHNR